MPNILTKARPEESRFYYHIIKIGFTGTSTSRNFLPMPGAETQREGTSMTNLSDQFVFQCPYDGSIEKAILRGETATDSTVIGFYTGTTQEIPSLLGGYDGDITVDCDTANTCFEFDFTSESNTFSKHMILAFAYQPTTGPGYCQIMIVLKFDVTT